MSADFKNNSHDHNNIKQLTKEQYAAMQLFMQHIILIRIYDLQHRTGRSFIKLRTYVIFYLLAYNVLWQILSVAAV